MKKTYIIIITLLFIITATFGINGAYKIVQTVNTSKLIQRKTVVIDAGHGGKDAGTIGVDNTEEKKINLEIALILRDYLMVSGINAVLIREGDNEYYPKGSDTSRSDLYNRLDFVNSVPNSVLISIHQNHYSEESAKGTQIWYAPNNLQSKQLADSILNNVKALLQPDNERLNKESDSSYYLLHKASVPSIMIECGFMSNREENGNLQNRTYQRQLSFSILTGICGEV